MRTLFKEVSKERVIIFLFIFQMLGVRIFKGIGIALSIIILCLLLPRIKLNANRFCLALLIAVLCGILQLAKGSTISATFNISIQIWNAILLAYLYSKRNFVYDLMPVLKFYSFQALATLLVVNTLPESMFSSGESILGKHLFYIFYRMDYETIGGIQRLSGWAWEPGCLQILLNLLLFLMIQDRNNGLKQLWWIVLLILATGSTSGYIVMLLNLSIYCLSHAKSSFFFIFFLVVIGQIVLLPFLMVNIDEKLMFSDNGISTSGIIRYRDFYTGLMCLRDYPLLGIDMTDLSTNPIYKKLEFESLNLTKVGADWYNYFDVAAGGYTNGLFCMTMMWGVFGLYLLFRFFKCSLWRQFSKKYWYIVPIIFILSIISEPITNTAFFWFFCIFDIVNRKNKIQLAHG